jgi:hypothetical protein
MSIEKLGGRKFVLTVILLVAMFGLAMTGKIAVEMFVNFVEVVSGMYLGANVIAKFSGKVGE